MIIECEPQLSRAETIRHCLHTASHKRRCIISVWCVCVCLRACMYMPLLFTFFERMKNIPQKNVSSFHSHTRIFVVFLVLWWLLTKSALGKWDQITALELDLFTLSDWDMENIPRLKQIKNKKATSDGTREEPFFHVIVQSDMLLFKIEALGRRIVSGWSNMWY